MRSPSHEPQLQMHPLALTGQRLGVAFQRFGFDTVPAAPDGWVSTDALFDPSSLGALIDQLAAERQGHRDAAGAWLALRYGSTVAMPLMASYLLEARVPYTTPATAAVHRAPKLTFDRFATGSTRMAVLPGDPDSHHPDVTVLDDHDTLTTMLVDTLEALVEPMVVGVRALVPFGRRGLWGLVLDMAGGAALAAARSYETDHRPSWAAFNDVVGRLAERDLPVGNRPRPLIIEHNGHEVPYAIKGTCCLKYKGHDGTIDEEDEADGYPPGYCHSCPLVDKQVVFRHYQKHV